MTDKVLDKGEMNTDSAVRGWRWKGWLFSGLIAYLIQGVAWALLGLSYSGWTEVWGEGMIVGRDEKIAEGIPVASAFGSVIGSAVFYGMIGFTIAGLIHMLAYSIPGGLFWAFTKRDSIFVRLPWVSWITGWALGTIAIGLFFFEEGGWFKSAAIIGGFYGILTAAVSCAVGRRLLGVTSQRKRKTTELGGGEPPGTLNSLPLEG